jgi:hypothetical protein
MWLLLELYGAAVPGTAAPSFFSHCVHTPLGTWVARYGRIRSSPQRYDFGVWHGHTRVHGLPIACPVATLVVRRRFQQHIIDMTRVWRTSAGKYDWHDFEYTVRAAAALAGDMGLSEEQVLLERTLTRGQFILWLSGCLAVHRQTLQHPRPSQGPDRPGS